LGVHTVMVTGDTIATATTAAALESARRVSRAMTTLIAAREAKQIDRRLVGAILEATSYRRAGLLDPPSPSIAARLRFAEGADDVAPLEIIGVSLRSPLAPGVALHRLVAGEETDLIPLRMRQDCEPYGKYGIFHISDDSGLPANAVSCRCQGDAFVDSPLKPGTWGTGRAASFAAASAGTLRRSSLN
jgi:hypothetical protein